MSNELTPKELEDLIKAYAPDRDFLIQDFMGNVISGAVIPEFETAIMEFLSRIDDDLFELITSEINPVVFNSFGASTTSRLIIMCNGEISPRPLQKISGDLNAHFIPYIVIGGGFMRRTPLGRVGEIAHEFAHAVLQHQGAQGHELDRGGKIVEAEADALAKSWGFDAEIDGMDVNMTDVMADALKESYAGLEQKVEVRTEELAASELRYRDLFEESRDAIFIASPEGRFIDVNRAALDLFGFTREEIIDSDVAPNWIDPQNRIRYLKELDEAGSVSNFEMMFLRKDGIILNCEVSAILRRGESGTETRIQGIVRDVTEIKRSEAAALEQAREVAVLEERNRMAREIHDTMAQGFTGIVLQMEAAEQSMETNPGALPEHLNRARALAREGLQEARRSVWGLVPHALERSTLDTALQEEVRRFDAEGRSKIAFTQSGKRRELPPDVQTVLLRICQESLTNIRRHADASQIDVTLDYHEHEVLLSVQDNGAGFDPPTVENEKRGVSFGLTGMRQRAEQINGQLTIDSAKNQGTTVRLTIPTP